MTKLIVLINLFLTLSAFAQNPNFVLLDHTNAPFVNDSITWVEVDTNNVKWIGTRDGLYRFNNNTWTVYNTSNSNIPSNRIDKFKIAHDNTIWFVNNNNGFYKFKNNTFTLFNQANLPALYTDSLVGLTIDSNDVFFWSDYNGIVKFNSLNNSVYNINTSNSCLKNIQSLVYHTNHTLYGTCTNPEASLSGFPQNKTDSIASAETFTLNNSTNPSISYCFRTYFSSCDFVYQIVDRYKNRFECTRQYIGPNPNQRLRTYDENNTLVSDVSYNGYFPSQIASNSFGKYEIDFNSPAPSGFKVTIFNPVYSNTFGFWNSIIPNAPVINFDVDSLNNVWLATPKGLVIYNYQGVVTNLEEKKINPIIKLYPNPTNGLITVKSEKLLSNATVRIFDVFGKLVAQEALINQTQNVNLEKLAKGLYYVGISNDNILYYKQKLIIQ